MSPTSKQPQMSNWTLHFHQVHTLVYINNAPVLLEQLLRLQNGRCMDASEGESSCGRESTEPEQILSNNRNVGPRKKKRHLCRFSYRLIKITGKGAVFMILYNIFFATTLLELNAKAYPSIDHSKVTTILLYIFALLCPCIGLVSDISSIDISS